MLIYQLCNLLPTHMKNNGKIIIKIFTSVLEPDAKEKYLEDFRNGDTKI